MTSPALRRFRAGAVSACAHREGHVNVATASPFPQTPPGECGPINQTSSMCTERLRECNAYLPLQFAGLTATVTTPVNFVTANYLSFTPVFLISTDAAGNDVINALQVSGTDYLDGAIPNDLFSQAARLGGDPLPFPAANMPKGGLTFTQAVPIVFTITTTGVITTANYYAIGIAER